MVARQALHLFFSFVKQDQSYLDEIEKGLTMLKRQGYISIWDERMISAGAEWRREVEEHLDLADIILLLISQDYLNSDFSYEIELKRAMERYNAGGVRIIPILINPCDWKQSPFSQLQVLPKNLKSVSEWQDQQAAIRDIVKNVQIAVEEILIGRDTKRILTTKAILTTNSSSTLSQLDKEKELERVEHELEADFEKRVSNEIRKREVELGQGKKTILTTNVLTTIATISLSCNLVGLFEFLIYLLPWRWLIEHPNSYGLQASFDALLIFLVIGIFYPKWRKWCWGGGAFAVLLVVTQILGGPPQGR